MLALDYQTAEIIENNLIRYERTIMQSSFMSRTVACFLLLLSLSSLRAQTIETKNEQITIKEYSCTQYEIIAMTLVNRGSDSF